MFIHRPLSSSFLWFIFRVLQGNPKKELLRGLWVGYTKHVPLLPSRGPAFLVHAKCGASRRRRIRWLHILLPRTSTTATNPDFCRTPSLVAAGEHPSRNSHPTPRDKAEGEKGVP